MDNKSSKLSYRLIEQITDNFSEDHELGSGEFGITYKGLDENLGEIAVKVIDSLEIGGIEFLKEFDNLKGLKHPNVGALVGFCNETKYEIVVFKGRHVMAESTGMMLCFEYVHNGSLHEQISDEHTGFNWHTRYSIIKAVCEGLKYLHEGQEYPITHLHLKPSNILLDKHMVPKIVDYGFPRLFGEETLREMMLSSGVCGYITNETASTDFDIFCLGVIIVKIMTGHEGYNSIVGMATSECVNLVHERWRKKLRETLSDLSLEVCCNQVKRCIEIALDCLKPKQYNRSTIKNILSSLNEPETMIGDQELQIEQGEPILPSQSSSNNIAINDDPAVSDLWSSMDGKLQQRASDEPSKLPYQLIKQITNNFDKNRILGSGGFGTVYKGVYENRGEIAVKVLHNISGLDDNAFHQEFDNLRGLKHPNIVELVGFCNESEEELAVFEGKQVTAERLRVALCFEYVQNGSLSKIISDEKTGLTWHTRYRIIKGICEGLKYLREGLAYPIMHFDLKPDNILLDKSMVPKIADFGLSKLFGEENTRKTISTAGTCGYWPPEYIKHQIISREFDIFSLGVIMVRIITGHECYNSIVEMPIRKSVKLVHESWRERLRGTLTHKALEVYCSQVKRCIEIALRCLISNRQERPTIQEIISSLNETEILIGDRRIQNEQFYQDVGESTVPSDVDVSSDITINSGPSSKNYSDVDARFMPLSLLKEMTDDFSEARLLGQGRRGKVYKGVYGDGQVIAVKTLYAKNTRQDIELTNEIGILDNVHHQNIVQLIGYCYEVQEFVAEFEGKHVISEKTHSALCFQYLQHGSLRNHISEDIDSGLSWQTRYEIVKGMCDGLRYLSEGLEIPILHMNLNPDNIFLDEMMVPKIGGFGSARQFGERRTDITENRMGTLVYMPPEFVAKQIISQEFDIYSLGVTTLQLTTGHQSYREFSEMPPQEFIDREHKKWRGRLQKTVDVTLVEGYCQQVKKCLEIAAKCVELDRHKRPSIGAIVDALSETEMLIPQLVIGPVLESELLLEVHPLELYFLAAMSSSSSVEVARKKKAAMMTSSCSLQLKNKGNDRVAFMLVANSPKRYLAKEPLYGVVSPRCSYSLTLTMRNNKKMIPSSSSDSSSVDFFTLYSVGLKEYDLLNIEKDSIAKIYDNFFNEAKEEVQEVTLKVVCDRPTADQQIPSPEIITTADAQQVLSIDVHPTEPWILTTNQAGGLRVWNYKTMATLSSFELSAYEPVHVAIFIARKKCLVVGDRDGGIYVYNYEDDDTESLEGHESCITTLAVHPTSPFVLSSSVDDDHLIKLWDWANGWDCTREFGGHTGRVTQVTFNPENSDHFASASLDGTIKVWSICSDDPSNIITLKLDEPVLCIDYFTRNKRQHMIVGCQDKTPQIWELGMQGRVHELDGHEDRISAVNLHPELSVLITGSLDGTVRVWDSTTFKPMNIMGFNLGAVYAFGCIKGSRRIVVGCLQGIAMVEIPLP